VSFFWILRPGEWKVMHLARLAGFFKNRKRGRQHLPLSIPITHLPDRAPIGNSMAAERGMPTARGIRAWGQHQRGKALLFEVAGSQSTDWQQNGQAGVSSTAPTPSVCMRRPSARWPAL